LASLRRNRHFDGGLGRITDAHRAKYTQKIETHLFIGTKRDLTRIVPNYAAFKKRIDSP
jgi:hypothetical protein